MTKRRWLALLLAIPLLGVYTLFVLVAASRSSGKVLFQSTQAPSVHYGSWDPYELRVLEGPARFGLFYSQPTAVIWVTKAGDPFYGHSIGTDLPSDVSDAVWTADGVDLRFASGHRLFIPKSAFVGGR